MWGVIAACAGQVRTAGMGQAIGLDFQAVLSLGAAARVDMALLADVLPAVEVAILKNSGGEGGNGEA